MMATDKRQFTMRMQPENFDKIRVIAAVNKRSAAMQIEYLIEKCINEYEEHFGKIPIVGSRTPNNVVQKNSGATNILNTGVNNNFGVVGGNFNSGVTIG